MASLSELLAAVAQHGATLRLSADGHQVRLVNGADVPHEVRAALREHTGELLQRLATGTATPEGPALSLVRAEGPTAPVVEPQDGAHLRPKLPRSRQVQRPPTDDERAEPLPDALLDAIPESVEEHFTRTPNVFFDHIFPRISNGELRVLLYVIRQYYGWAGGRRRAQTVLSYYEISHGFRDRAGNQADEGCGLGERQVKAMVAKLVVRGVLLREARKDRYGRSQASRFRLNTPDARRELARLRERETEG